MLLGVFLVHAAWLPGPWPAGGSPAAGQELGLTASQGFSNREALGDPAGVGLRFVTFPLSFAGLRTGYSYLRHGDTGAHTFCSTVSSAPGGGETCLQEEARESGRMHLLEGSLLLVVETDRGVWVEVGAGLTYGWAEATLRSTESSRGEGVDTGGRWGRTYTVGVSQTGLLGLPLLGTLSYSFRELDFDSDGGFYDPFAGGLELHQVEISLSYVW